MVTVERFKRDKESNCPLLLRTSQRDMSVTLSEAKDLCTFRRQAPIYPTVAVAGSSTPASRKNLAASSGGVGLM